MSSDTRFVALYTRKPRISPAERFWSKVTKTDTCWLWTAGLDAHGYGQFSVADYPYKAHRVSWELAYGTEPLLPVLHKCDTPACVRPDHLFLGTQAENCLDMWAKGRARPGDRWKARRAA